MRVNGRAWITRDPELLGRSAVQGRTPLLAIGVEVEQCFLHCAKAFRRSQLWTHEQWPGPDALPSLACVLFDQISARRCDARGLRARYRRRCEAALLVESGQVELPARAASPFRRPRAGTQQESGCHQHVQMVRGRDRDELEPSSTLGISTDSEPARPERLIDAAKAEFLDRSARCASLRFLPMIAYVAIAAMDDRAS